MNDPCPIRATGIFNQPLPPILTFNPGRLVILKGLLLGLDFRGYLVLVVFSSLAIVVLSLFVEPSVPLGRGPSPSTRILEGLEKGKDVSTYIGTTPLLLCLGSVNEAALAVFPDGVERMLVLSPRTRCWAGHYYRPSAHLAPVDGWSSSLP
jgi:hypothetical protein